MRKSTESKILAVVEQLAVGLHRLEGRFDKLEKKFDKLERKFDHLDAKVTGINEDLGAFRTETNARFDNVEEKLDVCISVVNEHDKHLFGPRAANA